MTQVEMDIRQECLKLLDLLARVIDANKGYSVSAISDGERLLDAHYLANKCVKHAITAFTVSRGMNISLLSSKEIKIIDVGSVDVLTRAAFEAFLTFHYVFFAPKTKEEKDYRYWAYSVAGIKWRRMLTVITSEYKQKIVEDEKELDKLRDELEANTVFQSLSDNQRKQIFKSKGEWKWKPGVKNHVSWSDIAIDAGFSEVLARHMYRLLCGFAHSSSLSIRQAAQAFRKGEEEYLISPSISVLDIVTANMIWEYCGLFSKAQGVLDMEPVASKMIEAWIEIGRRLDENLDIGQDSD